MPHHANASRSGKVTDIFAHRLVIETTSGERLLADLGPHGLEQVKPAVGDDIFVEGEQHPSEIKIRRLSRGETTFEIAKPSPRHHENADAADAQAAIEALAATGVKPIGAPRRRPHHFEIVAEDAGERYEYHVHDDGRIHRAKPTKDVANH